MRDLRIARNSHDFQIVGTLAESLAYLEIIARSKGPDNLLRTFSAQRRWDRRRVYNETRKDVVTISIFAVFGIRRPICVVINIPEAPPPVTGQFLEEANEPFGPLHPSRR